MQTAFCTLSFNNRLPQEGAGERSETEGVRFLRVSQLVRQFLEGNPSVFRFAKSASPKGEAICNSYFIPEFLLILRCFPECFL